MWETNKEEDVLKKKLIVTTELKDSVGNVALSASKNLLVAVCNDI